jgi:capsular polysaccharide transport system permease protein
VTADNTDPSARPAISWRARAQTSGHGKSRKPRLMRVRVISALVLREMATQYGRSWGGYFWALAEPLAGIVLLALIFSLALRLPPVGNSFMMFYATGILPFTMFSAVSASVSLAISQNKGLLTYPVVSAQDAIVARFLLEGVTTSAVAMLLLPLIVLFDRAVVQIDMLAITMGMLLAALLGLGMGLINAVAFAYFPTWRNLWGVFRRPLFIGSGIMFAFSSVPQPYQDWLWWNPLIHVVGQMRMGFYATYDGSYISWIYVLGLSLGAIAIFGYLVRRNESDLVER